jgi:DNA-binding XRE family transcriptional regulator
VETGGISLVSGGFSADTAGVIREPRPRAFAVRLEEYRTSDGTTQDDLASALAISRKTYILLESGRWLPGPRERHHMVHTLHRFDPALAATFAALYDTRLEEWGVAPPVAPARLDPVHARHAYDAAVYAAAEKADLPAKTFRPVVAAVLASLREAGMSLQQAVEVAHEASAGDGGRAGAKEGARARYRVEASEVVQEDAEDTKEQAGDAAGVEARRHTMVPPADVMA